MTASKKPRIAVGGFLHETNTFAPSRAAYHAFEEGGGWPGILRGEGIAPGSRGVNVSIAGFLASPHTESWDIVPTLWCAASPSGPVTDDAFERIAGELVARLVAALPLDGIYLDLHGAMVTESYDDGEGELLRRIREAVGSAVPLVASLDLHGNVTAAMVANADVLVAFRTYPHVDMAETGSRAAALLAPLIGGVLRPSKAFRQLPFLIPIVWQCTDMEPCRSIYADLADLERERGGSLSFLPGFPAADFPDCRPSVLAYAPTQPRADESADRLAERVVTAEADFDGEVFTPDAAVTRAIAGGKPGRPFVLADAQDNPGAGSSSDSTGMLAALVRAGAEEAALGLIVDPEAAAAAQRAGIGETLQLALGGRSGVPGDAPFRGTFTVEALSDGAVTTGGPYYGASAMNLGPSACLRIGGVRVVVSSYKAQMADQEMFRFVGIEPRDQSILVVKSSVHFRADFAPLAGAILICAAPGSMPVDTSVLPWKRLTPGVRLRPRGSAFQR